MRARNRQESLYTIYTFYTAIKPSTLQLQNFSAYSAPLRLCVKTQLQLLTPDT